MAIIKSGNSTDELSIDSTSKAARTTIYNSLGVDQSIITVTPITTLSSANTTVTLTIPAPGTGEYHYIKGIEVTRVNDSNAAITGTALLAYTTTNIPGSLAFTAGNLIAAGEQITDYNKEFTIPLKSSVAATATTIVAPAGGAGVKIRITVYYYTGL